MQYKQIDCKIKEIYFNAKPLKEDAEVIESRFNLVLKNLSKPTIYEKSIQVICALYCTYASFRSISTGCCEDYRFCSK